jgi:hypothetical protein
VILWIENGSGYDCWSVEEEDDVGSRRIIEVFDIYR